MLFAALASVVIASCYDGDTCRSTAGDNEGAARLLFLCSETGLEQNPEPDRGLF